MKNAIPWRDSQGEKDAAHIAGQPCPKARDVLDKWKENPPPDVATVTDNGLKYDDAKGNTKPADLEATPIIRHGLTPIPGY